MQIIEEELYRVYFPPKWDSKEVCKWLYYNGHGKAHLVDVGFPEWSTDSHGNNIYTVWPCYIAHIYVVHLSEGITVANLIEQLQKVEDKTRIVCWYDGDCETGVGVTPIESVEEKDNEEVTVEGEEFRANIVLVQ